MKLALSAALVAFCASGPALATAGLSCRSLQRGGPSLELTIGHSVGPEVIAASLTFGRTALGTAGDRPALAIVQSWIDSRHLWLDVSDADVMNYVAKLRATFQPKLRDRPAVGTIEHRGRTWRVRCVES